MGIEGGGSPSPTASRVEVWRWKICRKFEQVNGRPIWNQCRGAASIMPDRPTLLTAVNSLDLQQSYRELRLVIVG